jgi:hypothetical protein
MGRPCLDGDDAFMLSPFLMKGYGGNVGQGTPAHAVNSDGLGVPLKMHMHY